MTQTEHRDHKLALAVWRAKRQGATLTAANLRAVAREADALYRAAMGKAGRGRR